MSNTSPVVSVVVPCLNRADFLRPTIDSILGQDYPHIECIVVDGGSTDGTLEILESYGDQIRWVSEPDEGHADAINKGWRISQGEVLAWLNADDVWQVPDAVRRAVSFLEPHPDVDLVYGQCGRIDLDGNLIGMSYWRDWDLEHAVVHCDHCIPQPAAFIRRAAVERVGWLDTAFYQKKDHELWLRIGRAGKIRHIPELLAHARSQQGLSFDGRTAAPACPQVTRKFFSLPDVPERLRVRRRRAMSNSYLRGIDYAWAGGRIWSMVLWYAMRAIASDPSNARAAMRAVQRCAWGDVPLGPMLRLFLFASSLVRLPLAALRWLGSSARFLVSPNTPLPRNLLGDRDVEWSFVAANIPDGSGPALDFGCGTGMLGLVAAQAGYEVLAIDLQRVEWKYFHPKLRFLRADLLQFELPSCHYTLVINCSAVEHVGLGGRYGVTENRVDGDLEAMDRLFDSMVPGGVMLLTVPVGRDAVFEPMTRVYGVQRLPRLIERFDVVRQQYWVKDEGNRWISCDRDTALAFDASAGAPEPTHNVYGLGCLVLRKSDLDASESTERPGDPARV